MAAAPCPAAECDDYRAKLIVIVLICLLNDTIHRVSGTHQRPDM
jgi:hypothetical protein